MPAFSAPYPAGGLVEHIDYATYQKAILGQRPNMGALTDDVGAAPINLAWLKAGIALDSQITLSFDLATLEPKHVAEYRGLLNHYRPFTGTTRFDRVLAPSVFLTQKGQVAYLGLLNRAPEGKRFEVRLSDFGLSDSVEYTFFEVSDKKARRARGTFEASLPPHSFRLFVVVSQPAVVWTSSSQTSTTSGGRLSVQLGGPGPVPGITHVIVPPPTRVTLDGTPLILTSESAPGRGQYAYDPNGNLLTLRYRHDRPRQLDVEF